MRPVVFLLLLAAACSPPPEAPAELSDLTRWLYRVWADEDPRALSVGLDRLHEELGEYDLEAKVGERSWIVPPLTREDLAELEPPKGRDPADAKAVAVARHSRFGAADHARLQMLADQRPTEPTAGEYLRTFPGTDDPGCFPERTCERIATRNEVRRENLLMAADTVIHKHFRWVDWGDGREAIVARAWFEKSWPSDGGDAVLWQSYTLDVWLEVSDDALWRYQSTWSESDVGIDDEALIQATIRYGLDEVLKLNDEVLADGL